MLKSAPPTLLITSFHPGGIGRIGAGEALTNELVQGLLHANTALVIYCVAPNSQRRNPEVAQQCLAYIERPHNLWGALAGIAQAAWEGGLLSPWFFSRVSKQHVSEVQEIVDQYKVSRIWLNFPSALGFASHLSGYSLSYMVHDVVSQRIERRFLLRLSLPMVKKMEFKLLSKVSHCRVLSVKDSDLLREGGYQAEIEVAPPSQISAGEVFGARPIEDVIDGFQGHRNIVFFGNMGRIENHLSMLYFLVFSYRRLRSRHKNLQLWILGLSPRLTLRLLGGLLPGVRVTGAVDDPTAAFRAADLCIAPVRYGAGVKIKVLQMLQSGATVYASHIAAEGIAAHPKLHAFDDDDLPKAIGLFLAAREAESA
jgi:hypothetical protein